MFITNEWENGLKSLGINPHKSYAQVGLTF
jgi:hypothetical protein